MKKYFLASAWLFIFYPGQAKAFKDSLSIIPQPVSMVRSEGHYTLNNNFVIQAGGNAESVAQMLLKKISTATGYKGQVKNNSTSAVIAFALNPKDMQQLGNEGYRLTVNAKGVKIVAARPAGLFYGVQTLVQLFPAAIEAKTIVKKTSWTLPYVQITDYPRFAWRGLMLDVSRHFFTKEEVKKFIDDMSAYKFNLLHLHLTDDDGWRLEIKSYPKLTEVGAWRPDRTGTYTFFTHPEPDAPNTYGGFYTQEDIKEIVAYASKHFIDIMPEIDVPGHSLAAIAAYPELSCTPGNYRPCSGDTTMVWPKDDNFYAIYDNSLCAGKEEVYTFLDKVFNEVASLFPFEYIHVGGDENAKNFWENSEYIKKIMKDENIASVHDVQNYFTRRVEKIIRSKNKKMIGWDEILNGPLDPNTAIMSWQGVEGGIAAAKRQLNVVFASKSYAYFNYMQGDPAIEPPVHSTRLLRTTYEAEPLPEGTDSKYMKGVESCFWSEQIYNYRHLQYMMWPRCFAASEWSWGQPNRKNWPAFIRRIEDHFIRYDYAEKKYAPSIYEPLFSVTGANGGLQLKMEAQVDGVDFHYSFDNSYPDKFYPKYNEVITVPKDASLLRVICIRDGKQIGRDISVTIEQLKKRLK